MNPRNVSRTRWSVGICLALAALPVAQLPLPLARGDGLPQSPSTDGNQALHRYLESFALDRQARELLDQPDGWDDARQSLALRVLLRMALAPPEFQAAWVDAAVGLADLESPPADRLVSVAGRATRVAPMTLSTPQGEATGRTTLDLVRIVSDDGTIVDVITESAPHSWPRWEAIDKPASVYGLPLAAAGGPIPHSADGLAADWPTAPHAWLLVAPRVAWYPPTALGGLGMDHGLFDAVIDGQKLTSADADAFYGLLAAAGRAGEGTIAAAAGAEHSIVPLIDPAQHWFADHRGEAVAIDGVALRATRIEIDDPLRRRQTGLNHYWELFVFVNTPLIRVAGRIQETYPVVCCVGSLPDGMPTGQAIHEHVRVACFALKTYAYPLTTKGGVETKRESPLLVGGDVTWLPPPRPASSGPAGWLLQGLALIAVTGIAVAAWWGFRTGRERDRRRRQSLPEAWQPPGGEGGTDDRET